MALVAGQDVYSSLEIAPLESHQEVEGYVGRYKRVPMVQDNMELKYQVAAESPEITSLGGVTTLEMTAGLWRGSFRTLIYYNALWFHRLMCQLMGGQESVFLNRMPNGVLTTTGDANTHWYIPQSFNMTAVGSENGAPYGLGIRLIKGGPTNTANDGHRIDDCHVVSATFEFPETGWPTATWEVIGKYGVTLSPGGFTPQAVEANRYVCKPGDIGRAPSHATLPSLSTAGVVTGVRNIRSARIVVKNGLDFGILPFANAIDAHHRVGHEGKFEVDGTFTSLMQQSTLAVATAGEVYEQWTSNLFTGDQVRLRAVSAPDGATHSAQFPIAEQTDDIPYAFDIFLPNASIREANAPLSSPGTLNFDWAYKGFVGPIGTTATASTVTNYKAPVVFQFFVNHSDPPTPGVNYNTNAGGGHLPHTDLVV